MMDVNNEMVLMRKDIKKAKVHVISKLVRRIRLLKNKKGTDIQCQKHLNHARNLANEIEIIKAKNADSIFKYLLSSNLTIEDANKHGALSVPDRACIRIGEIPFIRHKMSAIRGRVRQFDASRSSKAETTSLRLVNRLSAPAAPRKGGEEVKEGRKRPRALDQDETPPRKNPRVVRDDLMTEDDHGFHEMAQRSAGDDVQPGSDEIASDCDVTDTIDEVEDQPIEAPDTEPRDPESYATAIDVVLPDFYAKPHEVPSKPDAKQKTPFDFSQSKSDDVSQVLSNIGTGFSDSDCDVTDEGAADDVTPVEGDSGNDDSFFVSDSGTTNASKRRRDVTVPLHRANVNSTFVTSLSDVKVEAPYRTKSDQPFCMEKKKNRLGQRRRKQKQHAIDHDRNAGRAKQMAVPAGGVKKSGKEKRNEPLHPSWEASNKRKEQAGIKEFSGTHIRFDDSD